MKRPTEPRDTVALAPPSGMRDLLLPESFARRELGRRVVETFALYGYDLVTTPAFEHADVIERGLEAVDRRDLLRFVEPETGEIALLRPDITPQIARIVATRLRERPGPWRLAYEGTVIRRRRGRARKQRQIAQAGVECVGVAGPEADAEVVTLAAHACESVGLDRFRIELRQVRIGREALETVPEGARAAIAEALARKDRAVLEQRLAEAGAGAREQKRLVALTELYGDLDVVREAKKHLRSPESRAALDRLADVAGRLRAGGLGPRLAIDLGELRGQAYYTGVSFTILAEGPGEPVGGGGRYDNLLARFGAPAPATGFALDLDNLEWALERAGRPFRPALPVRIALAAASSDATAALMAALRARGVTVADIGEHDAGAALAFARSWGYDAALVSDRRRDALVAVRVSDGQTRNVDSKTTIEQLDALRAWVRSEG